MSIEKAVFRLSDKSIEVVKCPERIKDCKNIGRNPHILQVLYLVYTGQAVVLDSSGKEISLKDLIERFGDRSLWILFSVYMDLRRRGRKVEPGILENELIIEKDRVKIYVFEENAPIEPRILLDVVDRNLKQGYRVIAAIVDMYGDVTYYELGKIIFPPIERRDSKQW